MNCIKTFQKRNLLLVLFVVAATAVLLCVRVFYLMVPGAAGLAAAAKELHERERVIKAERGKIYDRIITNSFPLSFSGLISKNPKKGR